MRAPSFTVLAVAALVPTALAGCGSSHRPLAARTPSEIVLAATRAIDQVHSVRVSGSVADGASATRIHIDLDLVNGEGAAGTVSEPGLRFRLIAIGGHAYIDGDASFWQQLGDASATGELAGRWARTADDEGPFAALRSFTDVRSLLARLLSAHGALTRGSTSTIAGQKVVSVLDASGQGTLYVATRGPAYPIRIADTSSDGGRINFSDFNARMKLSAPSAAVAVPVSSQ